MTKKIKIAILGLLLFSSTFALAQDVGVSCCLLGESDFYDYQTQLQVHVKYWSCSNGCSSATYSVWGNFIGGSQEVCEAP